MSRRLVSTAAAILATLAAMRSPCAAEVEGPTIRGRLGEPVPADTSDAAAPSSAAQQTQQAQRRLPLCFSSVRPRPSGRAERC
jgi:hypothetical protein